MASRQQVQAIQNRLALVNKSRGLLEKKSQALTLRYRSVMMSIRRTKEEMGQIMTDAFFALARAERTAGDFSPRAISSVGKAASVGVRGSVENIAGVQIPDLEITETGVPLPNLVLGMSRGGADIALARQAFEKATTFLVKLAALQNSYYRLESVIKLVNRRVNALEFVVMPKLESRLKWLKQELQQAELDETSRLKNIRDMIQRQNMEQAELRAARERELGIDVSAAELEARANGTVDAMQSATQFVFNVGQQGNSAMNIGGDDVFF